MVITKGKPVMTSIQLDFPVQGSTLPSDHGYQVFSAISELVPEIHGADWIAIHTFPGLKDGKGNITLPPNPTLSMRLPLEKVPTVYGLAGKKISMGKHSLRLGIPQIRMFKPSETLWARLVTLKLAGSEGKTAEPASFLTGVQRQIDALEIIGKASLELAATGEERDPYARRVVRIKGVTITGYGVYVSGLSDEDSLKLQVEGVGGRRRMGCGLFIPTKEGLNET
jgi:CRISPR-associated protein Cas6